MVAKTRSLLLLGVVLAVAVVALAVRQTRAEPFFFLPAPPAEQVGPVVAQAGPAGLTLYFGLLAAGGRATRGDGRVELALSDRQGPVYRHEHAMRATDFVVVRLAGPAGWQWSLLYGFTSLLYDERSPDWQRRPAAGPGQVQLTVTTADGRVVQGVAAISFPG